MSHILIVDDDELVAQLARGILFACGHVSDWVASGEEAARFVRGQRPDLVLLDQHMSGMTGVNLLRQWRSSEEFYDLPVIMLTAMTGEADEERVLFAGANDYVRKPFTKSSLAIPVDRLLIKRGAHTHLDLPSRLAEESGQFGQSTRKVMRFI